MDFPKRGFGVVVQLVLERAEKKAGGRAWAMPHHSKSGKGICGQCPLFKHRARALTWRASGIYGQLIIIKYGHFQAVEWKKMHYSNFVIQILYMLFQFKLALDNFMINGLENGQNLQQKLNL